MTSHGLGVLFEMRRLALLVFLLGIAMPALAVKRVTVEQLQEIVAGTHGKRDDEAARQLSNLELVERLSSDKLALWQGNLPGPEARLCLTNLARESVFLDLPRGELPSLPPPDLPEQRLAHHAALTGGLRQQDDPPAAKFLRDTGDDPL